MFSKRFLNARSFLNAMVMILALLLSLTTFSSEPIDLNTADVKALSSLKHIGNKKAQAIVAYREANGKFTSIDDLTKVKGIGKDTLEANRTVLIAAQ